MDNSVILQSLAEAFEVLKDSWSIKNEAITNCIVETEIYDGVLAMEMWAYVLRKNEKLLSNVENSEKLIYNVFYRFYKKYEKYSNEEYICRVILIHVAPHMVKCEPLIRMIFGKALNAGHITEKWIKFIPIVIAGMLLQEDERSVKLLMRSLAQNNSLKDISIGQLLIKANEYIEIIKNHLDDMDKASYKITPSVKNALLECISLLEDKEIRAECTIAVMSL